MTEELISFDTAKLAKNKGCRVKGIIVNNGEISRCTQSLLQRWLREVYNIHIIIGSSNSNKYDFAISSESGLSGFTTKLFRYNTYEEALEKGLQEALKLIK